MALDDTIFEGPDVIFVCGLPCYYTEAQVREMLACFGALRGVYLVKDGEYGNAAICVYHDSSVTDIVCAALNGIHIGADNTLTVARANRIQVLCGMFQSMFPFATGQTVATLAGAAAAVTAGQVPGPSPAIPGMFQNMFPSATGQFGALPVMPVQEMIQQATRHARRVYVGGLSPRANEQTVATFFSHVMSAIGGNTAGPGDAVVNVYMNPELNFAFVEMRSVEEASNAMALDGIIFEGAPVKVRRPSDYNPSLAATLGPSQPNPNLNMAAVGLNPGSDGGLEGPDRIFVGGLPCYFTEAQVRVLLESFGALQVFDLVKDRETGNSKGYAFCVYQDLSVTDVACAALNGIKMGDKTLTVRRADQYEIALQLQRLTLQPPTKVVSLSQVVTEEDLINDEDYEDIWEDMKSEGGKFGSLVNLVIPRPNPNGEFVTGVGKVFLEYAGIDSSTRARAGLNGRKFGGNQVLASFYPEDKFNLGEYDE